MVLGAGPSGLERLPYETITARKGKEVGGDSTRPSSRSRPWNKTRNTPASLPRTIAEPPPHPLALVSAPSGAERSSALTRGLTPKRRSRLRADVRNIAQILVLAFVGGLRGGASIQGQPLRDAQADCVPDWFT